MSYSEDGGRLKHKELTPEEIAELVAKGILTKNDVDKLWRLKAFIWNSATDEKGVPDGTPIGRARIQLAANPDEAQTIDHFSTVSTPRVIRWIQAKIDRGPKK